MVLVTKIKIPWGLFVVPKAATSDRAISKQFTEVINLSSTTSHNNAMIS